MKSLLLILISAYLLVCIILFFFQRKLLYFPTPAVKLLNEKAVVYKVNDTTLQGWVINEGKDKAIIYYGGNAESIELNINFFKELLPEYSIYLINYRGYGDSEGFASEQNLFTDALSIYDEIKGHHETISLIGRSLGSGVATYVASQKRVEKVVLITPYDSVQQVAQSIYKILPVSLLLKDKFLSYSYAKDITAQTLILYGDADEVIPPKHTENLMTYFNKEQLTALKIEGADHNSIGNHKEYVIALRKFLAP